MTSFQKNRSESYSMECSVIVKTDGEDVRVSPRRNEEGEWELDLSWHGGRRVVVPGGFPFEVTLPQFRHLQFLKISTEGIRTIPEGMKDLENVTQCMHMLGCGRLCGGSLLTLRVR